MDVLLLVQEVPGTMKATHVKLRHCSFFLGLCQDNVCTMAVFVHRY